MNSFLQRTLWLMSIYLALITAPPAVNAANNSIFNGGNGGGVASASATLGSFVEPRGNSSIFSGGDGDGYASASVMLGTFVEPRGNNSIFGGGSGDGYSQRSNLDELKTFATFMSSLGITGPLAAPLADYDADGWNNFAEYALGSDPGDPKSVPILLTTVMTDNLDGQQYLILQYQRFAGGITAIGSTYSVFSLIYQPQASYDLLDWSIPVTDLSELPSGLTPSLGFEIGTFRLPAPITGPLAVPRGFLRVLIQSTNGN